MAIQFDEELQGIIAELNVSTGYLACESVIIQNVRKHLKNGYSDEDIELYLKALLTSIEHIAAVHPDKTIVTSYRFAAGFTNTLLRVPGWRTWLTTIEN